MLQTADSPLDEKARRRFLDKVEVRVQSGECWEWIACRDRLGYGKFSLNSKARYAHRVGYMHWVGPIPEGLELDHLCSNPSCVNPSHLEPVTHEENLARGDCGINNARKTHCKQGHEFTPENTKPQKDGKGRACWTCHRLGEQRRRAR